MSSKNIRILLFLFVGGMLAYANVRAMNNFLPCPMIFPGHIFTVIEEGALQKLQEILEEDPSKIDVKNESDGKTLLHFAAFGGHLEIVKYLVEKNANLEAKDALNHTPLHAASVAGRLEVVKYLADKNIHLVEEKDNYGLTPLHRAAWQGHVEVVKYLVDKGSCFNTVDYAGKTPLLLAIEANRLNVVHYFIEKTTVFGVENNALRIALQYAAYLGKLEIVKYLLSCCTNSVDFFFVGTAVKSANENSKFLLTSAALLNGSKETGRLLQTYEIFLDMMKRSPDIYVPLLISPALNAFILKQLMPVTIRREASVNVHLFEATKKEALEALAIAFFRNADSGTYSIESVDRCAQVLKIFLKQANCLSIWNMGISVAPKLAKRLAQKELLGTSLKQNRLTDVSFAWDELN